MNDYFIYKESLGDTPEFLKKYLELDIVKRLKGISLLCGMDYASKYAYDFKCYISRYDHSLDVALIVWKLTHDKKATLAGLFHDISTPVFSHVIDYMNKDYIKQESTEEKTLEILMSSIELKKCLKVDNISLQEIADFKKYSLVDLDRPALCADRLDGTICSGINWTKSIDGETSKDIINDLILVKNESNQDEIAFKSEKYAKRFSNLNDEINEITHSNNDNYMMQLLADIVRLSINLEIVDYESLYYLIEEDIINCIEDNLDLSDELNRKWNLFKNIKDIPIIELPEVKNKIISPIVVDKRLKRML